MHQFRLLLTVVLILALPGLGVALQLRVSSEALVGRWALVRYVEGREDVTESRKPETWTFGKDGTFQRESGKEERREVGRYAVVEQQVHVELEGAKAPEVWDILQADGEQLQLHAPAVVSKDGVVISQERFGAFYHS